jgi:hypothetical protein
VFTESGKGNAQYPGASDAQLGRTGEVGAESDRRSRSQATNASASLDIILSAFVARVSDMITDYSSEEGIAIGPAGQIIRLSERYMQALNSHDEYRLFIATVSMTVKNSHGLINESKAATLNRAMSAFQESEKSREDSRRFTKAAIAAGLSPLTI